MKYLLYILSFFYLASSLQAQDTTTVQLDETVISASRTYQSKKAVAQQVTVLTQKNMERLNAPTTADLLQSSGAVFVQRSQQGGGSPGLRGFEASRVLLVVDGVRMNNAIYRSGHLQNVITLDNNLLERTEILFGPASTVYGSDALGGAIAFFSKKPVLSTNPGETLVKGNVLARYGTVNNEKTGHLDFSIGGSRLALLSSISFSDFGDLRMGENTGTKDDFGLRPVYAERINGRDSFITNTDPYVQKFSGYRQYDVLEKLLFQQNEEISHTINFQWSNSSNIPRYDRLTDLRPGTELLRYTDWYYGPQRRMLVAYQQDIQHLGWFNNGLHSTLSWQNIEESRHSRRFGNTALRSQIEQVQVIGFTSMAERVGERGSFRLGIDAQYNDISSTADETNIESGAETPTGTRYPDGGSTMFDWAVFTTLSQRRGAFTFSEGARVGYSSLAASFVNTELFPFPFSDVSQKSPVSSGSLGLVWAPGSSWQILANAATGFRMPNVDDLGKVFDSQTGSLIVPNPDIKPEQTLSTDLGWRFKSKDGFFQWETTLWHTFFRNAIVTDNFSFNGADSVLYDGVLSRVMANQNKRMARIYGLSSNINFRFSSQFSFQAAATWTKGEIISDRKGAYQPLDHIPPVFGRLGFRFASNRFDADLFSIFNGSKPIEDYFLNGEDNEQYAPEGGMPSWYTINLRAGYQFHEKFRIQAGIDNILDLQYRVFASGINAPGRNIFIALRSSF